MAIDMKTGELVGLTPGVASLQGARPANEDSVWFRPDLGIYMVADGIGGPGKGDHASKLLVSCLEQAVESTPSAPLDQVVAEALSLANRKIIACFLTDPALKGLGTTVTLALVQNGRARIWHLGDSRAYLIRGSKVTLLTEDHTLASHLAKIGQPIPEKGAHTLLRCLGKDAKCVFDTHEVDLQPGDRLLLCTDGVYRLWSDEELAALAAGSDLQKVADTLASEAITRGSNDNASSLIIGWAPGAAAVNSPPRAANEWQLLVSATREMAQAKSTESLVRIALDVTLELTGYERGYVFLRSSEGSWEPYGPNGRITEIPQYSRTLVNAVSESQEPLWIEDLSSDGRFNTAQSVLNQQIRSMIGFPLFDEGTVQGILYLDHGRLNSPMTEELSHTLTLLANYTATQLLSMSRLSRRNRELEAVQGLSRQLFAMQGVDQICATVLSHCLQLTKAANGAVFVGADLEPLTAIDGAGNAVAPPALDRELAERVIKSGSAELVVGGGATVQATVVGFDLTTAICAPMRSAKQVLGVVYLTANSVVAELSEHDLELVTQLLAYAGPAIENARQYRLLQESNASLSHALDGLKRNVDSASAPVSGDLATVRLEDVLAAHTQAKSTGWIMIEDGGSKGAIALREGGLILCRSTFGELTGVDALGELFSWQRGTFNFEGNAVPADPAFPSQALIEALEAAPRWRKVKARINVNGVPVRLDDLTAVDYPFDQWEVVSAIDGNKSVLQIAKALGDSRLLKVMEVLFELQTTCHLYLRIA